ncbi:hypothetical protein PL8927_600017 [Planktothrix serta PCC 8927]|uniref:Uncharacterized protein n=1 Tax=Planktothrix serta PCC 8927 TaxID=671068 RepID=A0A7Z9DXX1_9CYAN|nr:hypothetical protein PL8927_600017 [Planktothrix serta PCC 8927]
MWNEAVESAAKLEFPSPCGEKIGNNPIALETIANRIFKVLLREATD